MAEKYFKEIIPVEDGYEIGRKNPYQKFAHVIGIIFIAVIVYLVWTSIDFKKNIFDMRNLKYIAAFLIFYTVLIINVFGESLVHLDEKSKELIFTDSTGPFRRKVVVTLDSVRELNINHEIENDYDRKHNNGATTFYNIDLIDRELNAYRFFQSRQYDEELLDYAARLGDLLKVELTDTHYKEGYGSVYRKRII